MNKKVIFVLLCLFVAFVSHAQETISLAGTWTVKPDEQKAGEQQGWYRHMFDTKIQLPGTLDDAGIGQASTLSADSLTKEILLHLTRKHHYTGYAWYAKEVTIPAGWKNKHIELVLERVLWTTKIWIDGNEAGSRESLVTPHRYAVSELMTPGKHLLVIRVDNSKQYELSIRDMAHSYTNETQIIWNGIIGNMQLVSGSKSFISSVQVYPSVKDTSIRVRSVLRNEEQEPANGTLRLRLFNNKQAQVAEKRLLLQLPVGQQEQTLKLVIPAASLWNEFNPVLYTIRAEWISNAGNSSRKVQFGMREVSNANSQLQVNGQRIFLRGTLECDIFPLTGHPPMDKSGWLKVFTTAKSYGLNHLRFHSWCPPQAAFEVADSLGFYVQVELPFWNKNAGKDAQMDRFLEEEALRISEEYGNHPSFCFWSMGNELEGDFSWLSSMVAKLKQADPRHLYTTTSFTFQANHGRWPEAADEYFITQYTKKGWVRGQGIFNTYAPDFKTDYSKAIDSIPVPIITHEIGQYSVYPNLSEIAKYTGVLDPLNFKAIRNDLQRKQLLSLAPSYTLASGKFAANLYKEEIERALKTKGMSGFELLDLHDFPGQGTALVGILDAFWDSKGLVTAAEHRMYCSAVVPLLRFERSTYTNDELFTATAEIANFSNGPLNNATPVWTVKDATGKQVAAGTWKKQTIAVGNGIELGALSVNLSKLQQATALTIELKIQGTAYKNRWTIWVYPRQLPAVTGDVVSTSSLDEALTYLQQGKKVLLNPDTTALKGVEGRFAPVFWSPVHFPDQPGTMGLLMDPKHAALKNFPTDFYSNWQWWNLVTSSKTMIIDSLPAMQPIVRVIDNFFKNRKMATIIEARVGKGKLLLVSMDITHNLDKRPAARQLRYSLEKYMSSRDFDPGVELNEKQLHYLVK